MTRGHILPRDTMRKRDLCCRSGPSRSCIVSGQMKLQTSFSARQPHHSSFLIPSAGTQFKGEPLQRGRKIHGGAGKSQDIQLKSLFISETVGDRPIVATER